MNSYEKPLVEILEIELEDSVLFYASTGEGYRNPSDFGGDWN